MNPLHIDLTYDALNCWDCNCVLSQEKSKPKLRLADSECYVICEGCDDELSALHPPPYTVPFYGDSGCPICLEETQLWAILTDETFCGHTICENCLSSLESFKCPFCRKPFTTTWPIHVKRWGVERSLPSPGTTGLTNVFRVGELVWYKHSDHTPWRIAAILSITTKPGACVDPHATDPDHDFTLAPLGYSMVERENVTKDCQFMRPFLTLLLPPPHDSLRDKTFNTLDWQALVDHSIQLPDPNVAATALQRLGTEASKLAARALNESFSTFGLHSLGATHDGAIHVKSYKGVFLGAEMVLVGDPVRVQVEMPPPQVGRGLMNRTTTLLMQVNEIRVVEDSQQCLGSGLYFVGDVYRATRSRWAQPGTVCAEKLSRAFVEELSTLNSIETDKSMRWRWVKLWSRETFHQQNVLGRFYVTEKMRAVDPERKHQLWADEGLVLDGAYFDNREKRRTRGPGRVKTAVTQGWSTQFRMPDGMAED